MRAFNALRYLRMALELAALTGAIVLVALYAQTAELLPRPYVPYDSENGLVSDYGMGAVLTALFLIGMCVMGFLIMLSRFPRLYKTPVALNAGNVEIQYVLSKIMLSSLQIVCALYFSYLLVRVYQMEIRIESARFKILSAETLAVCGAIYLAYLAAAHKYK